MSQKRNITDFFKPFAFSEAPKRPPPDDDLDHSEPPRKSRSSTPARSQSIASETCHQAFSTLTRQNSGVESQGPLLASSQRVVKHGEVMIQNSDDDESDSDSSLEDLNDLLRPTGQQEPITSSPLTELGSPTPSAVERSSPEETVRTKRQTRAAAMNNVSSCQLTLPPPSKYKYDLGTLLQRSVKHEASEASISRARKTLEAFEQRNTRAGSETQDPQGDRKIDSNLISSALKGSAETNDVGRLMMAIQRTEALQQEKSWSFFDGDEESTFSDHAAFPVKHADQYRSVFKDKSSRQQAFLSGYVDDMASSGKLPDEIVLWLTDAACFEPREDLRHAYGHSVKDATKQIRSLLTPDRINALFQKAGAKPSALNPDSAIVPVVQTQTSNLELEARRHSIFVLCRVFIDRNATRNTCINIALEDTFEALVNSMPNDTAEFELQMILRMVFSSVTDVSLRSQLVNNIPASSSCLGLLRRRLALAFFFNDASYLSNERERLVNLGSMSHRLTQPGYAVGKDIDFTELAASISMLSIGVDNGDPPLAGFNRRGEKSFEEAIDMLSREIRAMNDRIIDTGASHMRRTLAKQLLEGFHSRLQYAIRTKPPPTRDVFGDADAIEKQANFMENHLRKSTGLTSLS